MNGMLVSRPWWALCLRGLLAIAFGVFAFTMPGLTIAVLVIWFGAYALVDGIFALIAAFQAATHHRRWWLLLLDGIIGIGAGIVTFAWPGNTALVLVMIIGAWAFLSGTFEIAGAVTAPWPAGARWLLALSGILSVTLGVLIMGFPLPAAFSVIWLIGAYALAFGLMLVVMGFRLKGSQKVGLATP